METSDLLEKFFKYFNLKDFKRVSWKFCGENVLLVSFLSNYRYRKYGCIIGWGGDAANFNCTSVWAAEAEKRNNGTWNSSVDIFFTYVNDNTAEFVFVE